MTDLAEWLLQQIAADERVAHSLAYERVVGASAEGGSELIPSCEAPHYQHDGLIWITTARVLAECEAKRRIVTETACARCLIEMEPCHHDTDAVRLLALPYADREGYREEWTP